MYIVLFYYYSILIYSIIICSNIITQYRLKKNPNLVPERMKPVPQSKNQQDNYKFIKLLGSGSFAKAYLVQEKQTGQEYVIKQIDLCQLSQKQQQSTKRQAKLLEVLDHPNIVKFKQIHTTSNMKLNIVMEYADGGDLASMIKCIKSWGTLIQEDGVLDLFTQICLAVKHMHDRNIIHRDLKGHNVFITNSRCVKIGDLGVAKILQHTAAKAKTVVGSPYYMSPEILQNKPYTSKTDIWSLGVILYEMCALQLPFTAYNIQSLALKVVKGAYKSIPPHYSEDLKRLIRSMLSTNINQRPNINQILNCPLINRRIKSLLTQSQNNKQFLQTFIDKFNLFKEVQAKLNSNFIQIEENNLSMNAVKVQKQRLNNNLCKAKTPSSHLKNVSPNKSGSNVSPNKNVSPTKNVSPNKNVSPTKNVSSIKKGNNVTPIKNKKMTKQNKIGPNTVEDLGQIMIIRPCSFSQHVAIPKLPNVTPRPTNKKSQQMQLYSRPQTSRQVVSRASCGSEQDVIRKRAISDVFNDKNSMQDAQLFCKYQKTKQNMEKVETKQKQNVLLKAEIQVYKEREEKQNCKADNQHRYMQNITNNYNSKTNNEPISTIKLELKEHNNICHPIEKQNAYYVQKQNAYKIQKQNNYHIQKQNNYQISKWKKKPLRAAQKQKQKTERWSIQPKQNKQDTKQSNLQLFSQRAITKYQKVAPGSHHPSSYKQEKQGEQSTNNNSEEDREQIVEQCKCNNNNIPDSYLQQQFQAYEDTGRFNNNFMVPQIQKGKGVADNKAQGQPNKIYKKMVDQLELITKLVNEVNIKVDSLPVFVNHSPQHYQPQPLNQSELQDNLTKPPPKFLTPKPSTIKNVPFIGDRSQLQNIRMALQEIFGVQNIITVYRYLSNRFSRGQQEFDQEKVIRELLKECKQIEETILRTNFRIIVAIIIMQNESLVV